MVSALTVADFADGLVIVHGASYLGPNQPMLRYRHNRFILTALFVTWVATGFHLVLFTRGTMRALGIFVVAVGLALPFWILVGASRGLQRQLRSQAELAARIQASTARTSHLVQTVVARLDELADDVSRKERELETLLQGMESMTAQLRWVTGSLDGLRFDQRIRLDRFSRAIIELADRHDVLRRQLDDLQEEAEPDSRNAK